MAEQHSKGPGEVEAGGQRQEQTNQRQMRLQVREGDMQRHYTNAFRTNTSAEEVIVDFGMNMVVPEPARDSESGEAEPAAGRVLFDVDNRMVMNYHTAKRLAMTLSQVVHRHEQRHGELKVDGGSSGQRGRDENT